MDLISFPFFLLSLAAIVGLRLPLPKLARQLVIFVLSSVFFASYYTTVREALPILGFIAFGYLAIYLVEKVSIRAVLPLFVVSITLVFAWLKQYPVMSLVVSQTDTPFKVVGLSYILFRILHLLVDVAQKATSCPNLIGYVNYCLFFPAFVSGPIQRYPDFKNEIEKKPDRLTSKDIEAALSRIFLGILLVMVVSTLAVDLCSVVQKKLYPHLSLETYRHSTASYLAVAASAYAVNIFANFAGYMHLIIGVMQLAGIQLPENFNQPYLAKNFLDFWARWHMTLSDWFKTYLFNPLMMRMTRVVSSEWLSPYLGSIAFFVTFFVMGVWHGTTLLFVYYGLFLGLGATINKLWQVYLAKAIGKPAYKDLVKRDWYYQLSRSLTLSYFATSLICLWIDPVRAGSFSWLRAGFVGFESFCLLTLLGMAAGVTYSATTRALPVATQNWSARRLEYARIAWLGLQLFLIVNVLLATGAKAPEFIYKAF